MYSPFQQAFRYLRYWLTASNGRGHGIHSPFVFAFIRNVLNDKSIYPEYRQIESLRSKLLTDNTPVPLEDYGAGSLQHISSRSVASITASSCKSRKYAQLLFRITRYYKPAYVLELGTSFGISTAYIAAANENAIVVTGEGNYVVSAMAKNNMDSLGIDNVQIITGNFDNTLPEITATVPAIDMAFIDGNHREGPTIKYFSELLSRISPSSVIILDDIHWSAGMEAAWKHIREHSASMLTIDLFFFGIVFFRPEFKVKQHFTIRF